MSQQFSSRQTVIIFGAFIAWFAVILQFYLIIVNRAASVPETVIRFFSFYTILTNILVATCFTALYFQSKSSGKRPSGKRFFARSSVQTALTVYITIVGSVYQLVLRQLWDPQGLQLLADELLHSVIPTYFLFYWLIFVPKAGLTWKHVFLWLLYPLGYVIFILIRGAWSGFYPYPFVDVDTLGYTKVFVNAAFLTLAFLLLSLVLVGAARLMRNKFSQNT